MSTVDQLLEWANKELVLLDNAQLDAIVLLENAANLSRAKVLSNPEFKISKTQAKLFKGNIIRRKKGEPLAYILGCKEFWSISLKVSDDVLIPRPDTETLVEVVLERLPNSSLKILDLGTGSGAIALSLAKERPNWQIVATDICVEALNVAKQNAIDNNISNVKFLAGSWYDSVKGLKFDAIVSNPPYIAIDDKNLEQSVIEYEPTKALISEENGLQDIKEIISSASKHLAKGGLLAIEHGFTQAKDVKKLMQSSGFKNIETIKDYSKQDRVTISFMF